MNVVFDDHQPTRKPFKEQTLLNRLVSGGGRSKNWIRVKVIRSPRRGGGVVLKPPRSYYTNFHKVRFSSNQLYSGKLKTNSAVDALHAPSWICKVLAALSIDSKVLVILEEGNAIRSSACNPFQRESCNCYNCKCSWHRNMTNFCHTSSYL